MEITQLILGFIFGLFAHDTLKDWIVRRTHDTKWN